LEEGRQRMMKRILLVIVLALPVLLAGCGGSKVGKNFLIQPKAPSDFAYHQENETAEFYWWLGQYYNTSSKRR
jgi:ABC-type glycerol-3-phosphate transport system substrate-binding protein